MPAPAWAPCWHDELLEQSRKPGVSTCLSLSSQVALLFDFADGRVARRRGEHSPFGQELDSLADTVSFGVAPAALGYGLGLRGGLDIIILIFFVACGISRLARYNVTASQLSDDSGKVKYFEGTPIPSSLVLVGTVGAVLLFRSDR